MSCGFNDEDYGCACPSSDKWYACPIESEKPENQQQMKDYVAWLDKVESEDKLDNDPIDIDKAVEHYEGTLEVLKGVDLEDKA